MDNLEVALSEPSEFNDPRRKVPRWYLHDGTTPLGITKLRHCRAADGLWFAV